MHSRVCGHRRYQPIPLPPTRFRNCAVNKQLLQSGDFALPARPQRFAVPKVLIALPAYGLLPLEVDPDEASKLADIFLQSRDQQGFFKIGEQSYAGYGTYLGISAALQPLIQERFTAMMKMEAKGVKEHMRRGLWYAMQHCRPLKAIVAQVSAALGCEVDRLRMLHLLRQSSPQCQFTWHNDQEDNVRLGRGMITVVLLLRGAESGMQVWGFRVYEYPHVGAGAAFPGLATHRSVYQLEGSTSRPEVVKMALFYN